MRVLCHTAHPEHRVVEGLGVVVEADEVRRADRGRSNRTGCTTPPGRWGAARTARRRGAPASRNSPTVRLRRSGGRAGSGCGRGRRHGAIGRRAGRRRRRPARCLGRRPGITLPLGRLGDGLGDLLRGEGARDQAGNGVVDRLPDRWGWSPGRDTALREGRVRARLPGWPSVFGSVTSDSEPIERRQGPVTARDPVLDDRRRRWSGT